MQLQLITPEKVLINEEVDSVFIPTPQGQIGVFPNHAPLITAVSPGELHAKKGARVDYIATGVGYAQVIDNKVAVLTDIGFRAEEISEQEEEEARKRAQIALSEKRSDEEVAATLALIERITAKINTKRRHRSHGVS